MDIGDLVNSDFLYLKNFVGLIIGRYEHMYEFGVRTDGKIEFIVDINGIKYVFLSDELTKL
jgi:hypothetical protein